MKGKRNKGITLIALVITIIVLLILAGVTIATLFGNNGILTESRLAVEANKEASAKEQVQLAWTACETEYQSAWIKDNSIVKRNYFEVEDLNRNLGIGEVTAVNFQETGKSTVTYKADDGTIYEFEIENGLVYVAGKSSDVTEPKKELTDIILSEDTINMKEGETRTLTATKVPTDAGDTLVFSSEKPEIATVDAASGEIKGISTGTTTITVKGTNKTEITKQCTVTVEKAPITSGYLVDVTEIGDYIDIGISYSNTESFNASTVVGSYAETGMTGWRVLSKTGNGNTGTVTLVSAGVPLSFWHQIGSAYTTIPMLEDLKKEITIIEGSYGTLGFTGNGFSSNNLKSIFEGCKFIDTNKNIHVLGCGTCFNGYSETKASAYSPLDEIETAYEVLTGTRKTMTELSNMSSPLKTVNMQSANPSFPENAKDLLGNGFAYYLGGTDYGVERLSVISSRMGFTGGGTLWYVSARWCRSIRNVGYGDSPCRYFKIWC